MSAALESALAPADLEVLGQARFFSGLDRGQRARVAALVETTPRRIATAYCLTPCAVIALPGAGLGALMQGDHTLGYALMKQLSILLTSELTAFAAG